MIQCVKNTENHGTGVYKSKFQTNTYVRLRSPRHSDGARVSISKNEIFEFFWIIFIVSLGLRCSMVVGLSVGIVGCWRGIWAHLTVSERNTIPDTWHDTWHMAHDTWHMTHDTWCHTAYHTWHTIHDIHGTWHLIYGTQTNDTWHTRRRKAVASPLPQNIPRPKDHDALSFEECSVRKARYRYRINPFSRMT